MPPRFVCIAMCALKKQRSSRTHGAASTTTASKTPIIKKHNVSDDLRGKAELTSNQEEGVFSHFVSMYKNTISRLGGFAHIKYV